MKVGAMSSFVRRGRRRQLWEGGRGCSPGPWALRVPGGPLERCPSSSGTLQPQPQPGHKLAAALSHRTLSPCTGTPALQGPAGPPPPAWTNPPASRLSPGLDLTFRSEACTPGPAVLPLEPAPAPLAPSPQEPCGMYLHLIVALSSHLNSLCF